MMNVSAKDISSGKEEKTRITNDKGRLCQREIDKMLIKTRNEEVS
jgi:molecular chaperone DnaK (HSP70)